MEIALQVKLGLVSYSSITFTMYAHCQTALPCFLKELNGKDVVHVQVAGVLTVDSVLTAWT